MKVSNEGLDPVPIIPDFMSKKTKVQEVLPFANVGLNRNGPALKRRLSIQRERNKKRMANTLSQRIEQLDATLRGTNNSGAKEGALNKTNALAFDIGSQMTIKNTKSVLTNDGRNML